MSAYITEEQRYKIEAYLDIKMPVPQIAKHLEKARSTIYKEMAKGRLMQLDTRLIPHYSYCADFAQRVHEEAVACKGKMPKLLKDEALLSYVETKILGHYSPEAIVEQKKHHGQPLGICAKTIYNGIYKGLFPNLDRTSLTYKMRNTAHKKTESDEFKKQKIFRTMITERPEYINDRSEFGHWEMDLVTCRKSKQCLFVLVERLSRFSLIFKLAGATQAQVKRVLDFLEKQYGDNFQKLFKSFTTDNGTEFMDHDGITQSIYHDAKRTQVFYCHSYCSWEKGTVENLNRFIRRHIPKGTDISLFDPAAIKAIQEWINQYPRKIFDFGNAEEVFKKEYLRLFA